MLALLQKKLTEMGVGNYDFAILAVWRLQVRTHFVKRAGLL